MYNAITSLVCPNISDLQKKKKEDLNERNAAIIQKIIYLEGVKEMFIFKVLHTLQEYTK